MKATAFQILRGVNASGIVQIQPGRQHLSFATLWNGKSIGKIKYFIRLKTVCLIMFAGVILQGVAGCEQANNTRAISYTPDSLVSKPISLKDLSTGVKAGNPSAHWSYFGKERDVQIERLPDGTVATISVLMDGGDAYNLRNELETKYSKEEGRTVRFDCNMNDRRLAMLNDARVWDTVCTIRNKAQVLTVYEVGPDDPKLISDHYALRGLFYSTKVTLVDTRLATLYQKAVERDAADAKKREAEKEKKELDLAKQDI